MSLLSCECKTEKVNFEATAADVLEVYGNKESSVEDLTAPEPLVYSQDSSQSSLSSEPLVAINAAMPVRSVPQMLMSGRLGDCPDALFSYFRGDNFYQYQNIKRTLKLVSYNPSNGQLIFNGYDQKGKYIGKFVGKFSSKREHYEGTFTNYKGIKITFCFDYDIVWHEAYRQADAGIL